MDQPMPVSLDGGHSLLVTVITPSYNRAPLLEETIRCVRAQTYPAIEHIVIDGGSGDGSVEILQEWEKRGGIRWLSEPDGGMYEAVNKGLRLASGDILAYLNTDDRYFPYSVQTAVQALSSDPDIGFIFSDMLNFDESRKRGSIYFYPPFDRDYFARGGWIGQPTVFWRRAVTDGYGGFDTSLKLGADMEYWARISQTFRGRRLEEILAYEGQHDQRLTSGDQARAQGLRELNIIRQRYDSQPDPPGRPAIIAARLREAIRYRRAALRFLWFSAVGPKGQPGHRWQGFLQRKHRFTIHPVCLLAGLLPVIGRRSKDFISAAE